MSCGEYERVGAGKRVLEYVIYSLWRWYSKLTRLLSDGAYMRYSRPRRLLEGNLHARAFPYMRW
jgi:hypothetical protein